MPSSDIFALAYFALGVIILFLGLVIFRENPKGRLNRIVSLMLFFASLGPILGALGIIIQPEQKLVGGALFSSTVYYNLFYVWELFFPCLILFALAFPQPKPYLRRKFYWILLFFLPHLFHILLVSVFNQPDKIAGLVSTENSSDLGKLLLEPIGVAWKLFVTLFGAAYSAHLKFFSLINFSYILAALLILNQSYREVTQPRIKPQLQTILLGLTVALGLYSVAFLIPNLTPWEVIEPVRYALAILALVAGAGSIAWAIIRHHFLDIRAIVRQSLAYTVTSALLIGVYLLLISKFSALFSGLLGKKMPFLEVGMIILALIFFQPVLTQVDELVRRMIVKDRTDLRQALEEYSRKIVSVFNLEKLKQMTFETIDTYLGVPKTVLVIWDKPDQSAQVHTNRGIQLVETKADALLEALEERNSPLFVDDWEKQSPLFEKLREEDVHLLLPLNSQEELSGILGIGKKESRFGFSYDDISFLKVLANQLVIAISNVGLYQEALEKQIMEEELSLARQIQLELLPRSIPRHSSFELAGFIQPSRQVGGDYYDLVWDGSETLGMAIADTVGKGMPAALLVSILHATLRAEMKSKNAPAPALANLNQILCSATRPGHFATLFYGIFLPQTAELVYCNAGHNYPMLVRSNGELCNLDKGGLILGAFPDAIYQEGRVKVQPNDVLIMYTDGLSEAQNDSEEEFGEKRILDLVIKHRELPAQKIIDEILLSVNIYAPKPQDDLTMVVAKIL